MPEDKLPEPGEFTRMFKRQQMKAHNPDTPLQPALSADPPATPPAGDSTPPSSEPGEFTRYFSGTFSPKRSTHPPAGVQRPASSVPWPASNDSSGAFSQSFGNGPASQSKPHHSGYGATPDLSRTSDESSNPFDPRPSLPIPPAAEKSEGEFTRLFGRNARPPEPRQAVVAHPRLEPLMNDSPRFPQNTPSGSPTFTDTAAEKTEQSDFSKALNTKQPQAPAARPPVAVNISGANPFSHAMQMPTASANVSGAHMATPLGNASVTAPSVPHIAAPNLNFAPAQAAAGMGRLSDQGKLIIFFAVLAILSIILVVALVVTQKAQ